MRSWRKRSHVQLAVSAGSIVALAKGLKRARKPSAIGGGRTARDVAGVGDRTFGQGLEQAYKKASKVMCEVVRASNAVECVNSVVRMHQARHRNLMQELIDLKRLYWNSRSFVGGKRKGRLPVPAPGRKITYV